MIPNIADRVYGRAPIDLLITEAKVLNVFTMEFEVRDVMIDRGMIIGFGSGDAKQVVNAHGKYLIPGLIDSHMHIESTMLSPVEYSKVALANGVTTVFADCHEIANVLGTDGLDYMLCEVEKALIDINVMLPSSVPCSHLATANQQLKAADLCGYYSDPFVYGLAELMDYNRVEQADPDYLQKIKDTNRRNLIVDGHMAGLDRKQVDVLRNYGVANDHESESKEQLLERLSRGVNIFIREGSAAKNFTDLMGAVTIANNNQISFCTDDISLVDLIDKGSINNIIRQGISQGYSPELLLKMATYNAACAYNLRDKGAIAPGYNADLLIVSDLAAFTIEKVYKDGREMNQYLDFSLAHDPVADSVILNTVDIAVDVEAIDLTPKYPLAIEVTNGSLVTGKAKLSSSQLGRLAKVVVVNRYGQDNYFVAYIKGFDLTSGVVASTISHDSHNLVMIGTDDLQIRQMLNYVKHSKGGIFTLFDGKIDHCELEIGGLMSNNSINQTYAQFKKLLDNVKVVNLDEPFLAMSFLTLDVIPYLKITDQGLYDFESNTLLN